MDRYKELTKDVPWSSLGEETIVSKVGRSLVPVGILPFQPLPSNTDPMPYISSKHPDMEKYLMNIVGTGIQAATDKIVTCSHVAEVLMEQKSHGYILGRIIRSNVVVYTPYPIQIALRYVDPRSNKVNKNVDLATLIVCAKSTEKKPYEIPNVKWGDSSKLGTGDQVVVGGYPHGTEMFKFTQSNRGIIQPTFYLGIVSAILPSTKCEETRIIQISLPSAGGMSGGAVFDPSNGEVLGMITSCVYANGIPQPISYALPSEIIWPFVEVISFEKKN